MLLRAALINSQQSISKLSRQQAADVVQLTIETQARTM